MTIPSDIQGVLAPEELAYLLELVNVAPSAASSLGLAEGVDSGQGLAKLKENGWMTPAQPGWNLHWSLPLMASVLATPDRAITMTRHLETEGDARAFDVTIGLFEFEGVMVELFPAESGYGFIVTDGELHLSEKASMFGQGIDESGVDAPSLGIRAEVFERAMANREADNSAEAVKSLFANSVSADAAQKISTAVSSGKKLATIESVGFVGGLPVLRKDLYCLGDPAVIVAGERRSGTDILVAPYSAGAFTDTVELMWDSVKVDKNQLESLLQNS